MKTNGMFRVVNRVYLDVWLEANAPDGVAKLALKSKVSTSLINRIRSTGIAPKKEITQKALAKALKASIDDIFPEIPEV